MNAVTQPTAILLPPREAFTREGAGAIALTVAEQLRTGSGREQVEIWGRAPNGELLALPEQTPYVPLPELAWVPGRRRARHAWGVRLQAIRRRPWRLEIHNRAELFRRLASGSSRLALYLHNDPKGIRGLERAEQRRAVLGRADYVVCVSDFLRRRFCEGLGADCAERVEVIANSVDLDAFRPQPKRREILFVGRLIPEKGALELAEALLEVLPYHPEVTARFIGAWHFGQAGVRFPYERRLEALVARSGGQIRLEGYRPYDEVAAAFGRAEIAVVPSLWDEPFGRTALEAMAAGCAVLASDRGGLPEVVGDAGQVVEPTPAALAEAFGELLASPARCEALGRAARHRAETVFDAAALHRRMAALRDWRD